MSDALKDLVADFRQNLLGSAFGITVSVPKLIALLDAVEWLDEGLRALSIQALPAPDRDYARDVQAEARAACEVKNGR